MLLWNKELEAWIPECVRITGRPDIKPREYSGNRTEDIEEFRLLRKLEKEGAIIVSSVAKAEKKRLDKKRVERRRTKENTYEGNYKI